MKYNLSCWTPSPAISAAARRMSASLRFLLITRRMRSDPASGATVTLRAPPAASAAARRGVTQSALSDDGDRRPSRDAASSASRSTPGMLAISAPTSPIVPRWASPRSISGRSAAALR